MAVHPANAVFVSGDGKVSFNEKGRKLDSNGNVVWGDYQGLRGANARVRPEIIRAYEEEEKERQRLAAQQAQAAPAPAGLSAGLAVGGGGGQAPQGAQPSPWSGVSSWMSPGGQVSPGASEPPRYDPLSSAPPQPQNWNQFTPPASAWQPPPSGLGGQPVMGENSNAPLPPGMLNVMGQNWNRFRR